jgi:hypothetical protein
MRARRCGGRSRPPRGRGLSVWLRPGLRADPPRARRAVGPAWRRRSLPSSSQAGPSRRAVLPATRARCHKSCSLGRYPGARALSILCPLLGLFCPPGVVPERSPATRASGAPRRPVERAYGSQGLPRRGRACCAARCRPRRSRAPFLWQRVEVRRVPGGADAWLLYRTAPWSPTPLRSRSSEKWQAA